jgi:hypothetical protein
MQGCEGGNAVATSTMAPAPIRSTVAAILDGLGAAT